MDEKLASTEFLQNLEHPGNLHSEYEMWERATRPERERLIHDLSWNPSIPKTELSLAPSTPVGEESVIVCGFGASSSVSGARS